MKTRVIAALALTGAAVLASCSQDRAPVSPLPTEATFARGTTPTCSFSTATNDAKSYFVDNKDVVFTLLNTMQKSWQSYGASAASTITAGYDVLNRVAVARSAGSSAVKGTPSQGSTFVNDVFLCMTVTGYSYNATQFANALDTYGLFAVRDNTLSAPVVSRNYTDGVPDYGAEPTSGNWPLSARSLFYGENLLGQSSIAGQQAAGVLFDLKTLPTNPFTDVFRVGVCNLTNLSARTLHQHTGDPTVILPPNQVPGFCTTPPTSTASRGGVTQMLASFFSPTPLYAATFGGGGAGLVSGLSQIGPVTFTDSLAFQGTIPNGVVRDSILGIDTLPNGQLDTTTTQLNPPVMVRAVSKEGKLALVGVKITLAVVGNSGSFKYGGAEAFTDNAGYARFPNFWVNKAGGYTITASSEFGPASTITSNLFNITGN